MFDTTREELTNTLADYGYLVEDRVSILSVFTDDSQLVAEFHLNDDVVMRGAYLPAWGPWVRPDEIDDVIEFLCSEANMHRTTEELLTALDEAVTDDNEGEDEDY